MPIDPKSLYARGLISDAALEALNEARVNKVGPSRLMIGSSNTDAPVAAPSMPGSAGFARVVGPVPSDPGYVYHATSSERALDIASSGKLGRARPWDYTDQSTWPDGSKEMRNYFTPTAQNTWQFAPEEGQPTILRIPRASHPFKLEGTGDFYSTKDVSSGKIEALGADGNWAPLNSYLGQ